MTTDDKTKYYQSTQHREMRPELKFALSQVHSGKTAIDCGCGAGANIKHLRAAGFTVYAFDNDDCSIQLCRQQYNNDSEVHLSLESFGSYQYPCSSLILADASLFFCPLDEIDLFAKKMSISLESNGIFCGGFLGARDTMANGNGKTSNYWGKVLVLNESRIRDLLSNFNILKWTELETEGLTPTGETHHWHMHNIVAKRI